MKGQGGLLKALIILTALSALVLLGTDLTVKEGDKIMMRSDNKK